MQRHDLISPEVPQLGETDGSMEDAILEKEPCFSVRTAPELYLGANYVAAILLVLAAPTFGMEESAEW